MMSFALPKMHTKLFTGQNSYEVFAHNVKQERIVFLTYPQITPAIKTRLADVFPHKTICFVKYPFGYPDIDELEEFHHDFWDSYIFENTMLVGFGGGSVLDCAKVLRFEASGKEWLKKNVDKPFKAKDTKSLPLALIPTTAGTGSEVTSTATIWNKTKVKKHSFYGKPVFADYAVVSGEFNLGNSWSATRDTALDALSHALEALWNVNRTFESNDYAILAARLICYNLPKIKDNIDDLSLRNNLSSASLLAGLAMAKTETALAHALSYDLTLKSSFSHGAAVAHWLPYLWNLLDHSQDDEGKRLIKQALKKIGSTPQDLENWLTMLGVPSLPIGANSPLITLQIAEKINSPRGKNFSIFLKN
jgi:alcohol dehydrogenase